MDKTERFELRLTPDEHAALEYLAAISKQTMSEVVCLLLGEEIERRKKPVQSE